MSLRSRAEVPSGIQRQSTGRGLAAKPTKARCTLCPPSGYESSTQRVKKEDGTSYIVVIVQSATDRFVG